MHVPRRINSRFKSVTTAGLGILFAVTFGWQYLLFSQYQREAPRHPIPSQGLVYPFNDHGSVFYVTARQYHQYHLLWRIDEWIVYPYALLVIAPAAWREARARRRPKRPR